MAKAKTQEKARAKESRYQLLPIGHQVKSVLRVAYRARRPVLLEGPTGIGKSEIVQQLAADMGIDLVVLDLSLLEPPDLVGLPRVEDGRTTYAPPNILPTEGRGILMLEELNRAERYIQQPALQLLTGRQLHEYVLPEGWSTCAAINPERGEYQVTPLDPALRSRFLNLLVRADRKSWLDWAQGDGVHQAVLNVALNDDHVFDDVPPRSWTYVSEVLKVLEPDELRDARLLRATLLGYLPAAWVEVLLNALENVETDSEIDVPALLGSYHQQPQLQETVCGYLAQGQTDRLERLANRLQSVLEGPQLSALIGRDEVRLEAFEKLMADLPGDHREKLQHTFTQNLAATSLVGVPPDHLLKGYDSSPLRKRVDGWLSDPIKRCRVDLLVRSLCHHLEEVADIITLRKNTGAMIGLGFFVNQLDTHQAAPLRQTLKRLSVDPIYPKSRRKRPR